MDTYRFNKKKVLMAFYRKYTSTSQSKDNSDDIEKKVIEIVTKDPRKDYGLPFSTWSLRVF